MTFSCNSLIKIYNQFRPYSMFTGVSSENNHTVGDIAEYGVCSDCGVGISALVPIDQRRTDHRAEPIAAIKSLQVAGGTQVATCTDSFYVHSGGPALCPALDRQGSDWFTKCKGLQCSPARGSEGRPRARWAWFGPAVIHASVKQLQLYLQPPPPHIDP